jgi:hypothetical protein
MSTSNRRYRVPDPLDSFEAALRFDHLDLSELDDLSLWQEERRVGDALAYASGSTSDHRDWLIERLAMVRRERSGRGRSNVGL